MRIAAFERGGKEEWGLVAGEGIVPAASAGLPADLASLFARDPLELLAEVRTLPVPSLRLSDVALRAPLRPPKIVCVGLNYADHAAETGMKIPKEPVLFAKLPNSVAGPHDDIRCPGFVERLDYEAELGVVVGRRAKGVASARAMEHVLGYVAVNDVSARDLQMRDGQWTRSKSMDTFCPAGPWIVTRDGVPDPHRLRIWARVNGEVRQDSSTANMTVKVPDLIAYISRSITLEPGDLIATGTPAGVGMARRPPAFLKEGDVVEVEVESVGTLRNRVRMER